MLLHISDVSGLKLLSFLTTFPINSPGSQAEKGDKGMAKVSGQAGDPGDTVPNSANGTNQKELSSNHS